MATLTHTENGTETGGERSIVLAVLPMDDTDLNVLRYAAMVAAVDARQLRVMVLRTRLGLTTDASLVAARRRIRNEVRRLVGEFGGDAVQVDELVVSRRTRRDSEALWAEVVHAARLRQAAAVVVPPELGDGAPRTVPGITVVTVLGRSTHHGRSDHADRW